MTSFIDQLQRASFRGVPFGVLSSEGEFGRRLALHEYPFRDEPFPEDLGRKTRRITMRGFLVENSLIYGGGSVLAQRDAMVAAAETEGPGTLVHPTLGRMTVSCGGLTVAEGLEEGGRYFALGFTLIESGERQFPTVTTDTASFSRSSAFDLDGAAQAGFVLRAAPLLALGTPIFGQALATIALWIAVGTALGRDATSLFRLNAALSGNFGRYFGGRNVGFTGIPGVAARSATTGSLIVLGTTLRSAIATAAASLELAAETGDIAGMAVAAQSFAAALLAASSDPADAVRILASLADFAPDAATSTDAIGTGMATMQAAVGDLARRSAIGALARASSLYQPSSADDALAVRGLVVGLINDEITVAGDQGEDATYGALRTMRAAVATDLNARGATLAALKSFAFAASLPSLTLAHRIYRDASRADELVRQVDPPHPLFFPHRFTALAD